MKRSDLEHILRAAGEIADCDEIVVVGSQSILGQFPDAPKDLCVSAEADVYPRQHPERADLIDGTIGELSPFHETFGYYAQGVGEATAVLPSGWHDRLIRINNANTRGITGLCLEIHDLLIAKAIAGRPKDIAFLRTAIGHRLASQEILLQRLDAVPNIDAEARTRTEALLRRCFVEAS